MHLFDEELMTVVTPFLAVQEMMQDIPENKQIKSQVNLVKILSNQKTAEMMSGSCAFKTKGLFEMFHLTNRMR